MISHHLRFANANASLLLNSAICNFQWGPPNVGPNKAPSFKAKGTIWFSDEFILSTKENGHKELGQATGFTNTYCPKTTAYPLVRIIWNVKILENAYNRPRHQLFVLPKPKALWWTMRAFRIVVGIKATTAQLVDLYVNACLRWWLFIIVNAFGLKDLGFIRLLKPISVLAVNNRVPAPFSKMYTNALRNLSKFWNTLSVSIHLI